VGLEIRTKMIFGGASKEEVKFVLLNAPDKMAKFTEKTVDAEVHRAFAKLEEGEEEEAVEVVTELPKKVTIEENKGKTLSTVRQKRGEEKEQV